MRTEDPASVLFGRARRLVLGWLYGHPDEAFYLRQIARRTGLPVGSIQRELQQLTAAGFITRRREGHQVYFQANQASPLFPELSSLLTKTVGIADVLRKALVPLRKKVRVALLYGSAARNELRAGSDIDVMVIGDVSFGEVVEALSSAEQALGREVNPSVYPPSEFREKVTAGHHFVNAVLHEPHLLLIGDDDELERVAGTQQVAGRAHGNQKRNSGTPVRRPTGSARKRR